MPAIRSSDVDSLDVDTYAPSAPKWGSAERRRAEKTGVLPSTSFPSLWHFDEFKPGVPPKACPSRSSLITTRRSSSSSATLVFEAQTPKSTDIESTSSSAVAGICEPVTICGIELHPTVGFDTFWRVAAERKAIDDKRRARQPAPWTNDRILRDYFFCNTYRVLDKGCQFLIQEVIEKGSQDPTEVIFRVLLFNLYTKIETWKLLDRALGPLTWKAYDREKYRQVLAQATDEGMTLYTGAFIKPAPHFGFQQNYLNHLCFLEMLMENELPARLLGAPYMDDVYEYLVSFPSMGPFSTYQLMLCLSYTKVLNFHDNDFVIAGPGSRSGLKKLFGEKMVHGRSAVPRFDEEVMRYMAEHQDYHFKRLGIEFSGLGPKRLPMGVADIEHMLCEVDKYCRVAHPRLKGKRTNLHRTFTPSETKGYSDVPAILPKAWSLPARRVPRIRPDRVLVVHKRYEISHISDHQDTEDGKQFLVFWVGYSPSDATWEFESSLLQDAPAAVSEYLSKMKTKEGT